MTAGEPPDDQDDPNALNTPPIDPLNEANAAYKRRRFPAREEDFDGANDEAVAIRISMLEEEHRDLDAAIRALEESAPYERLAIARLKKKKLSLKDQIQALKDSMLPDIIA